MIRACLLLCALPAIASAHVVDRYQQLAQLDVGSDVAVELYLTPGAQVVDRVWALVDTDHDGRASAAEARAYAERVRDDVRLEMDGRRVPLTLSLVEVPTRQQLVDELGPIRVSLVARTALAGEHTLTFRNDHLPDLSRYLVNVLSPTSAVTVGPPHRDPLQRELAVVVRVRDARVAWWLAVLAFCAALLTWRGVRSRSSRTSASAALPS
jgi:hypothetical protein